MLFMGVPLGKSERKGFGKDVRFDSALRKVEVKIASRITTLGKIWRTST